MDIHHKKYKKPQNFTLDIKQKSVADKKSTIPSHETQFLQFIIYNDYLYELRLKSQGLKAGRYIFKFIWNCGELYRFHYRSRAKKRPIKWKNLKLKIHNKIALIMLYATTEKSKKSRTKQIKSHKYQQSKMFLLHCQISSTQTCS